MVVNLGQNNFKLWDPKKPKICAEINSYLEYCALIRRMSSCTLANKLSTYRCLIGETSCESLRDFTNDEYNKFVRAEIARGISASSVNQKVANIVALLKFMGENGLEIPLKTPLIVKLPEKPRRRVYYTREEIGAVLAECQNDLEWLLIKIGFDTGMRIAELTNLRIGQIRGRRINFVGKGSKAREVYLSAEAERRLRVYLDRQKIVDRLWVGDWGESLSVGTIRKLMWTAFLRLGHRDFHPHALRHSFGSDLQRQGADIMAIKEMMGHSSVATTQKYLHGFEGRLEELFRKYKS